MKIQLNLSKFEVEILKVFEKVCLWESMSVEVSTEW